MTDSTLRSSVGVPVEAELRGDRTLTDTRAARRGGAAAIASPALAQRETRHAAPTSA